MASSDLASALRTRRYTLQLCSYSQELFLAYLMEHKFMVVFGQRFSYLPFKHQHVYCYVRGKRLATPLIGHRTCKRRTLLRVEWLIVATSALA